MRQPVDEETLRRLDERADALEARTARPTPHQGEQAVGQAYRLLGVLLGGVLVGLALGFGIDAVLGSAPWGVIGGVLLGSGVSVFMAVRSAQKLSRTWETDHGPARDVPFDDDEED